MNRPKPIMLMILDGWGYRQAQTGNAVAQANTPFLDALQKNYPATRLKCSGESVGLPPGVMGNSEVGHLNIGAGRIVNQALLRIDKSISAGEFAENRQLNRVMKQVAQNGSALHLMGLVSDGGVHSHLNHLLTLVDMACGLGLEKIYMHAILDGRDTPPDSGIGYVRTLQEHLHASTAGTLATLCGRYYAMDRDNRWERTRKSFRLYTQAQGIEKSDPVKALSDAYKDGQTDEFVKPITLTADGIIRDTDGVIFFNFRADRARQITRAFTDPHFDGFTRAVFPDLCDYVCMTLYDAGFKLPVAFAPIHLDAILGEVISRRGLRQLRIAETEKYAHVTYFFNGGAEDPFELEDRCLLPSPKEVATYDLKPEMSAHLVGEEVLTRLESNSYDLIVLNFANMDMVGHSGIMEAAIKACEVVDKEVGRIVDAVKRLGGAVLLTADHGNAEQMLEENGKVHTAHSLNPVPFIIVDDADRNRQLREGILADIAPTILQLMGIDPPSQMTGKSLIA